MVYISPLVYDLCEGPYSWCWSEREGESERVVPKIIGGRICNHSISQSGSSQTLPLEHSERVLVKVTFRIFSPMTCTGSGGFHCALAVMQKHDKLPETWMAMARSETARQLHFKCKRPDSFVWTHDAVGPAATGSWQRPREKYLAARASWCEVQRWDRFAANVTADWLLELRWIKYCTIKINWVCIGDIQWQY